jgi:hypothetical protein
LTLRLKCSSFVLRSQDPEDEDGQLHTLGLLEQLHGKSSALWHAASDFHFRVDDMMRQLADPNLHEIHNMCYRIDLWDKHAVHGRWLLAATGNVFVARAAFGEAVKHWPNQRLTLRNGMQLLDENPWPVGKRR